MIINDNMNDNTIVNNNNNQTILLSENSTIMLANVLMTLKSKSSVDIAGDRFKKYWKYTFYGIQKNFLNNNIMNNNILSKINNFMFEPFKRDKFQIEKNIDATGSCLFDSLRLLLSGKDNDNYLPILQPNLTTLSNKTAVLADKLNKLDEYWNELDDFRDKIVDNLNDNYDNPKDANYSYSPLCCWKYWESSSFNIIKNNNNLDDIMTTQYKNVHSLDQYKILAKIDGFMVQKWKYFLLQIYLMLIFVS
jgi:hypothetical protein